jgi:hypothetical protein
VHPAGDFIEGLSEVPDGNGFAEMFTPFVPLPVAFTSGVLGVVGFIGGCIGRCRMDLFGPNTLLGTRTDYSVGPWDYSTWAARHLLASSARTSVEKYSDRKLCMSLTM